MPHVAVALALTAVVSCSSFAGSPESPADAGDPDAGGSPGNDAAPPPPDAAPAVDAGGDASTGTPGDLVVLRGEDLASTDGTHVSEWPNALDPQLKALPTSGSSFPTLVPQATPTGNVSCAAWADGVAPFAAQLGDAYAIGTADYSLTVVAKRNTTLSSLDDGRVAVSIAHHLPGSIDWSGIAIMTEYQDAERTGPSKAFKFAARATFLSGTAVEAVETTTGDDKLHVVVAYRRGSDLRLRVDGVTYGPTGGADAAPVPTGEPMVLGGEYLDDTAGTFSGRLCHVVLHKGAETDAEIAARVTALKGKFGL